MKASPKDHLIDLASFRRQKMERRIFGPWLRRFGEKFDLETRLGDLSDRTLHRLATPGEESSASLERFIAEVRETQGAANPAAEPVLRVDIHLFMADQLRFEVLWRLDWAGPFSAQVRPLYDLVAAFESHDPRSVGEVPALKRGHPRFGEYALLPARERAVMVRKLLSEAMAAFGARAGQ